MATLCMWPGLLSVSFSQESRKRARTAEGAGLFSGPRHSARHQTSQKARKRTMKLPCPRRHGYPKSREVVVVVPPFRAIAPEAARSAAVHRDDAIEVTLRRAVDPSLPHRKLQPLLVAPSPHAYVQRKAAWRHIRDFELYLTQPRKLR